MAFEQETQLMVNIIFITTMLVTLFVLMYFYLRTKNSKLFWYIGSTLVVSIGYYFLTVLLFGNRDVSQPMVSEENSMIITFSVLSWLFGMILLQIGFWKNSKEIGKSR